MCLSIRISSTLHHDASYLSSLPLSSSHDPEFSRVARQPPSPKWTKYRVCERNVVLHDFVEWKARGHRENIFPQCNNNGKNFSEIRTSELRREREKCSANMQRKRETPLKPNARKHVEKLILRCNNFFNVKIQRMSCGFENGISSQCGQNKFHGSGIFNFIS